MISQINKQRKEGGFFSAESINEFLESKKSTDWFNIKFDANDTEFNYTPEQQTEISNEVKSELIERALKNLSTTTYAPKPVNPKMPSLPESGAFIASKEISKACGFHLYCGVSSFVLKSLNSIFGSSTAVSKFIQNHSSWVNESVDQVQVFRRDTSLTFSK